MGKCQEAATKWYNETAEFRASILVLVDTASLDRDLFDISIGTCTFFAFC